MKDFEIIPIADGADMLLVEAERFKTNEISLSFAVPLQQETAAVNALLFYLLSRSCKAYPTMRDMNVKLSMLYGATVQTTVQKLGENQVLSLIASGLNDRFSLEGGSISLAIIELLISLITAPKLDENGFFFDEDIEREKRLLIEKLESEENDKRIFALRRMEEEMFAGESYAVNRYGTVAEIKAVSKAQLKTALQSIRRHAKIGLTVVGSADVEKVKVLLGNALADWQRAYQPPVKSAAVPPVQQPKDITQSMQVKQGKLVLGFRVNMESDDAETPAMRAFCDAFGGGPYSRLFLNVREKLSLCYYCAARYDRRKSNVIIQCGCEEENMDKAIAEILAQLQAMQQGAFGEELAASKIGLSDLIIAAEDDSFTLLLWYANQLCDERVKSPRASAAENNAVTPEQIRRCASLLSLDTVFRLTAEKEGK